MNARVWTIAALMGAAMTFSAQSKDKLVVHGSTTVLNAIMQPKQAEIEKAAGLKLELVGNGSG